MKKILLGAFLAIAAAIAVAQGPGLNPSPPLPANAVAITGGTINGTPIGGTTPAAGAFTTGTFSSTLGVTGTTTSVGTAAVAKIAVDGTGTTTSAHVFTLSNTGATMRLGIGASTTSSGFTNSAAYSTFFGSDGATSVHLGTNGIVRFTIDSAGAVTVPGTLGLSGTKIAFSATAPTLASGGCTSAAMVDNAGTAYFTATVGTSGCSGSQPLVFTLPAATVGWNCYARNGTTSATSAPAQTGVPSTTSVTITNFVRTTGVAGVWTANDNIQVSCLGG